MKVMNDVLSVLADFVGQPLHMGIVFLDNLRASITRLLLEFGGKVIMVCDLIIISGLLKV
jgi:hypothetical protein